jgi:hypothetical protein
VASRSRRSKTAIRADRGSAGPSAHRLAPRRLRSRRAAGPRPKWRLPALHGTYRGRRSARALLRNRRAAPAAHPRLAHEPDIAVGSSYDAERDESYAFEELISFHGGLGGPKTRPLILHPERLPQPRSRLSAPPPCTPCSQAGGACCRAPAAAAAEAQSEPTTAPTAGLGPSGSFTAGMAKRDPRLMAAVDDESEGDQHCAHSSVTTLLSRWAPSPDRRRHRCTGDLHRALPRSARAPHERTRRRRPRAWRSPRTLRDGFHPIGGMRWDRCSATLCRRLRSGRRGASTDRIGKGATGSGRVSATCRVAGVREDHGLDRGDTEQDREKRSDRRPTSSRTIAS